jgi:hypothetical protein
MKITLSVSVDKDVGNFLGSVVPSSKQVDCFSAEHRRAVLDWRYIVVAIPKNNSSRQQLKLLGIECCHRALLFNSR